jgi:NADH-quinone oxidoreductase subunit H
MYSALYNALHGVVSFFLDLPFWVFGAEGAPDWLVFVTLSLIFGAVFMMGFIAVLAMAAVWAERKVSAHMQARLGPMEVGGFHGWLQTVADSLKLLLKEDVVPAMADKTLFLVAPMMVFSGALMAYVTIPFGPRLNVANLNLGVFYILATGALVVVGIIMAGWASHNKWSIYGGMRAACLYIGYEVPSALHLLPGILMAGSLNMVVISNSQALYLFGGDPQSGGLANLPKDFSFLTWSVWPWVNPFATVSFIMFYIASLAETNRTPFDFAESESELVAGTHTEYSGIRWSFFFLSEYAEMFVVSALATVVFLGGWHGIPLIPPVAEFLLKSMSLMLLAMWLRWTLPRLRIDQLTYMCWKVLLPFGLVTTLGTAFWQLYFYRTTPGAVVGVVLTVVVVYVMRRIWKSERIPEESPESEIQNEGAIA